MNTNDSINVEEIMRGIRQKIKDENLTADMLSFSDVPSAENILAAEGGYNAGLLQHSTEYVSARNQIPLGGPIGGNPIKAFVKKVIRKLIMFYILPIMTEQNALNYHFANAVMQLNGYVQKNCGNDPAAMAVKLEELELKQLNNKREIAELTAQVEELKKMLAEAKAGE